MEGGSQLAASWPRPPAYRYEILDLNSQIGNCIPLADIRKVTWVHDIECHPGQGAKQARAAGTFAKIMKEPAPPTLSLRLVRLATLALSETRKKRLMHLPGSGWIQLDQLG